MVGLVYKAAFVWLALTVTTEHVLMAVYPGCTPLHLQLYGHAGVRRGTAKVLLGQSLPTPDKVSAYSDKQMQETDHLHHPSRVEEFAEMLLEFRMRQQKDDAWVHTRLSHLLAFQELCAASAGLPHPCSPGLL